MKDYSVLEGLNRNFINELRCAYDRGYINGRGDEWAETQAKPKEEEDYKRGLETAWECAKRIMSMPLSDQEKIFNMQDERAIMDAHSAEEAIDILKRYDEKHYDVPESMRGEINIGDEVKITEEDGIFRAIVIRRDNTKYPYTIMYDNGDTQYAEEGSLEKTGRHFDAFENLLKQMQANE